MKNNKKGFTLIEVIAVVVIIALLAGISIPLVSRYLKEGKESFNKNLEKELLVAANSYLADNPKQRPLGRNATDFSKTVYLADLESKNYLNDVLKDADGGECTSSFVSYNYDGKNVQSLACLKCDNYETDSQVCSSINADRDECKNFKVDYTLGGVVEYNGQLYDINNLPDGWTNKNITYTFKPSSENQGGTNIDFTYIVVNGHRIKLDSSYTFKEKQKELIVKLFDNCGNSYTFKKPDTSKEDDYYIKIDKGSPMAKLNVDGRVNIEYDKTSIESSGTIDFSDTDSGLDYFIFKYSSINSWDFDEAKRVELNGEHEATSSVSNTFTNVGVYYLNVRVFDKAGNSYTTSKTINVTKGTKEYSISYDGCGATISENLKSGQVKIADQPLTLLTDVPSKKNYNFLGWGLNSCDSSVSYSAGGSYDLNSDNTLYAIWQEKNTEKFTITYITNSNDTIPSQAKVKGEEVKLSSAFPVKDYYSFVKWVGSDNKEYKPGATYSTDKDLVLTANYKGNKITINYYADGGTWNGNEKGSIDRSGLISYGNTTGFHWFEYGDTRQRNLWDYDGNYINIVKKGYIPVKGKEWKSMSTSGPYAGKTYDQSVNYSDYCDAKDGDCIARVKLNWTTKVLGVNYNCDGSVKTETFTYGNNTKSNVTCSKYGYELSGWATSKDGKKIKNVNFTADGDFIEKYYNNGKALTLYPVYTPKKITFVYKTDGTEQKSYTYDFGTTVKVAGEGVISSSEFGTSKGYTFMGWRLANNRKTSSGDLYFLGSDGVWRGKTEFQSGYQYKILANKCFSGSNDCVEDSITLNATFFNNIDGVEKIYLDAVWAKFDFDTASCSCNGCNKIVGNVYSIYGGTNWNIYTMADGESKWTTTPENKRMPWDAGRDVMSFSFNANRSIGRWKNYSRSIKAQACLSQNPHKCINYNSSYLYSKNNSGLCSSGSSGGGTGTVSGCSYVTLNCAVNKCTMYSKSSSNSYQIKYATISVSDGYLIAQRNGQTVELSTGAGHFGQWFTWKSSGTITVKGVADLNNGEKCTSYVKFSH